MTALRTGEVAPGFDLPGIGSQAISLENLLRTGPVVLAFFKISCPVCQYAFPYLERLYRTYAGSNVSFLGISQDDEQGTRRFLEEFGISFPTALDNLKKYPVSNAYGITHVPTIFFLAEDGEIVVSSVGWSRADMEEVNHRIAEHIGSDRGPLFQSEEQVADFRAG